LWQTEKTRISGVSARHSYPTYVASAPIQAGHAGGFSTTRTVEYVVMEDIRMRDRAYAEKRAREEAQRQRSAEADSANSSQGKQPARSGEKGKHTPVDL
jgi:putative heme iron utilization protein